MKPIVRDFANWAEYRSEIERIVKEMPEAAVGFGSREWSLGVQGVGEALKIADQGWPEGMEFVKRIAMPTVNALAGEMQHADLSFDVTGAAFDVGEYLNETPECWITPLHIETRPCVTIAANIVSSGGIPASALRMRGAAIVALTLVLQQSGYVVRVYAIEGARVDFKQDVWHRVCLTDDQGGPLDTDRLLFALAHPAAAREMGYALAIAMGDEATTGERPERYQRGLGWCQDDNAGKGCHGPGETGWKADFELNAPFYDDANWANEESVAAWVKDAYEKIAGKPAY